jgi:hypothetical protein
LSQFLRRWAVLPLQACLDGERTLIRLIQVRLDVILRAASADAALVFQSIMGQQNGKQHCCLL